MHPWLVNGWPITSYGACIVCGLIAAWLLARRSAKRVGLDVSFIDLMVPLLVGAGLFGAYAFGCWTDATTDEAAHGVVLVGAMIASMLFGIVYAVVARIPLGVIGDVFAAPAALGIAFGRIGCFFAGCCYGKLAVLPWMGVRFPRGSFAFIDHVQHGWLTSDALCSLPVYPVQLLEAGLCREMLAWILGSQLLEKTISGERFLLLGIGYAAIRFPMEFLRADNPAVVGGLTFSQAGCVAIATTAGITMVLRRQSAERWNLTNAALAK